VRLHDHRPDLLISPRVVKTFYTAQNKSGGFGGGYGHSSHLAGTYAALLSLALVGGEEAYTLIDRDAMWHWLGRLKQQDGGFRVAEGGEEDVRGAYCALVAISLLDLPLTLPPESPAREAGFETFFDGLGEYLSRCQTYEGGIGSSPGNEAHGAYAFCVVACLCLYDAPHRAIAKYLDMESLVWWLSTRQYGPEGGLAGRTNKLVDGCYSGWLGGCWPLVQAALSGPKDSNLTANTVIRENLYSSEGLARYILSCCQAKHGGLRDKPSK
jgi:protein farnesyltransferase subunit beta